MRPPKTLLIALTSVLALAISPAFAAEMPASDQVQIEIDLDVSPAEAYEQIKSQAWAVCKDDTAGIAASVRNHLRRDCQKQVVSDVMSQLAVREDTQFANSALVETH